jgi:hypothetical protein
MAWMHAYVAPNKVNRAGERGSARAHGHEEETTGGTGSSKDTLQTGHARRISGQVNESEGTDCVFDLALLKLLIETREKVVDLDKTFHHRNRLLRDRTLLHNFLLLRVIAHQLF